jgi:hypothetical protein
MRHKKLFGLLAWVWLTGASYADEWYAFRDLGTFGGTSAGIQAINDNGVFVVIATGFSDSQVRSFIVDGSRVTSLPPGYYAYAINSRGDVVGAQVVGNSSQAFVYRDGVLTLLSPGLMLSEARAINDKGVIAGAAGPVDSISGATRAVVWENGVLRALDGFTYSEILNGNQGYATGINESGNVAGYLLVEGWSAGAVYWVNDAVQRLHYPGQAPGMNSTYWATAINEAGAIATYTGQMDTTCTARRVYIYHDGAYDVVPLPRSGFAYAINDAGTVAGNMIGPAANCNQPDSNLPKFPYAGDARGYSLLPVPAGALGGSAAAINNHGTAAGSVTLASGEGHAALWEKATIRVNAGGGEYTDPQGNVWSADTGFSGGSSFSVTRAISNTAAQPLYQSERWSSGSLNYNFTVPNGTYTVTLKFAEIYFTSPGQRVFHILLNGQTVQSNFDIVAQAGGPDRAVDRSYAISVTGGQVAIQLTGVVDHPKISAIEITQGGPAVSVSVSPATSTRSFGQTQQFTVTGIDNTAVAWSLSPSVGSISAGGLYTAPDTISVLQTVTVTATSQADASKRGTATVTLTPTAVSVSVDPVNAFLNGGGTAIFNARVTGSANTAVTWSLSPNVGSIENLGGAPPSIRYTAPATIVTTQTITVTATSQADASKSATGSVILAAPVFQAVRVNAGGGAYTDPQGNVWSADTGFTGGNTYSVTRPIANTTTQPLYQSERWNTGPLNYNFAVPTGWYVVTLKFAETFFTAPGQRKFDILVNGRTFQSSFDIFARAGGADRAVDLSYEVSDLYGQIAIQLNPVVDHPKISAIQIAPKTVFLSLSPGIVSLSAGQTQQFTANASGGATTAVTWTISPNAGSISNSGLYTAPATISAGQQVTVTATSQAEPTSLGRAYVNLTPPPPPSVQPIRVNAGGGSYTDPQGNVWSADTGSTGGNTYSVTRPIANTTTQTLYQSERWNTGPLNYNFAVPSGTYTVTLKFAEIFFTAAGQRVFNILLNGQAAQTNFDIFAQAGGADRAVDVSYTVYASSGQIAIQLTPIVDHPKVSAIQIVQAGTAVGVSVTPAVVTRSAGQTQQFTASVTGSSNTAVTWTISPNAGSISGSGLYTAPATIGAQQTVTVTATSQADPTSSGRATVTLTATAFQPIRVNAGGGSYTDPQGNVWSADTGFTGGSSYSVTRPIANTTTQLLYQSERWKTGSLDYNFAVPNGTYTVTLKFAEIYFTAAGQRRFYILLNGQNVENGFDIFAQAGGADRAVDRSYTVSVTNGQITIELAAFIDNPKISAIQIVQAGT